MKMNAFEKKILKKAEKLALNKPVKKEGQVGWKSPSNIAIVKYWGKYPGQIPANGSLSITLSKAVTKTEIHYLCSGKKSAPQLTFEFEGKQQSAFAERIRKYLESITKYMPWLGQTTLSIKSENTFPHSSGIASSASAMSAIALCLCEIEEHLYGKSTTKDFFRKASFMARIGSGSASRSLYGGMAEWGSTISNKDSSDEYAIPVTEIHKNFSGMKDSILIIESGQKQVSSSLGHDLMKTNPYARLRFDAAEENLQKLYAVLRNGDIGHFLDLAENEALSLHAMMMTSSPGYILMKPKTIEAIQRIRAFRKETGRSIGFTLDAGANVHVLYPKEQEEEIGTFIENELKDLCENGMIIHDEMGNGPEKTLS
jgi:diphosphomevalonate decarboxylase